MPSTKRDLHSVEPLGPTGLTPSRLSNAVNDNSVCGVIAEGIQVAAIAAVSPHTSWAEYNSVGP